MHEPVSVQENKMHKFSGNFRYKLIALSRPEDQTKY